MAGATDDEVLQLAYDQRGVLITEDKDFGHLVFARAPSCMWVAITYMLLSGSLNWAVNYREERIHGKARGGITIPQKQ